MTHMQASPKPSSLSQDNLMTDPSSGEEVVFEAALKSRYERLSLLTLDMAEEAAMTARDHSRLASPKQVAKDLTQQRQGRFEYHIAAMTKAVWAHRVIEQLRHKLARAQKLQDYRQSQKEIMGQPFGAGISKPEYIVSQIEQWVGRKTNEQPEEGGQIDDVSLSPAQGEMISHEIESEINSAQIKAEEGGEDFLDPHHIISTHAVGHSVLPEDGINPVEHFQQGASSIQDEAATTMWSPWQKKPVMTPP